MVTEKLVEQFARFKELGGEKQSLPQEIFQEEIFRPGARIDVAQATHFQALMQRPVQGVPMDGNSLLSNKIRYMPSLMESVTQEANKLTTVPPKDAAEHIARMQDKASQSIAQLTQQLNDPNLRIEGSRQRLLQDKLKSIEEHLQIALRKVGEEQNVKLSTPRISLADPIRNFLSKLTRADHTLRHLSSEIQSQGELNPKAMLSIQLKMYMVSHELELFSSLLSKSIEGVRTIMNTQV